MSCTRNTEQILRAKVVSCVFKMYIIAAGDNNKNTNHGCGQERI